MKNSAEFIKKSISSKYLSTRSNANKNSLKDFDEWSVSNLPEMPLNAKIMDLGAGNGKQIELFSKYFNKNSEFVAMDINEKSLENIKNNYSSFPKLKLLNMSFNDIHKCLRVYSGYFDLIYSFYALYYVNSLRKMIKTVYNCIKKGGIFWVVSPYTGTNKELFQIIEKYYEINDKVKYSIDEFSGDCINIAQEEGFSNIKISLFNNKVIFRNVDDLMNYLRNTTFYNSKYEKNIVEEIKSYFSKEEMFQLSKNVVSIQLRKVK